jgi:hypothetical protein
MALFEHTFSRPFSENSQVYCPTDSQLLLVFLLNFNPSIMREKACHVFELFAGVFFYPIGNYANII